MDKGCPKFPYKIWCLKGRGTLFLRRAWVGWSYVVGGFVDGGFGFVGDITLCGTGDKKDEREEVIVRGGAKFKVWTTSSAAEIYSGEELL